MEHGLDLKNRRNSGQKKETIKSHHMEKNIDKHVPIDLTHLKEEPAGTIMNAFVSEAIRNGWTQDEVYTFYREAIYQRTDAHFWKTICLYTNTPESDDSDAKEDTRCVRFGISDIIVGSNEVPLKYAEIFDVNGELLGEVEVYIIGYETCEGESKT